MTTETTETEKILFVIATILVAVGFITAAVGLAKARKPLKRVPYELPGPSGPVGPTGPAGSIGPTGPAGPMGGYNAGPLLYVSLQTPYTTSAQTTPAVVAFDNVNSVYLAPASAYSASTGTFTAPTAGLYLVNYAMNTQQAETAVNVLCSVMVNGVAVAVASTYTQEASSTYAVNACTAVALQVNDKVSMSVTTAAPVKVLSKGTFMEISYIRP